MYSVGRILGLDNINMGSAHDHLLAVLWDAWWSRVEALRRAAGELKEGRADGPGGRDWLACAFQMPGLVFVAAVCTPGRTRGRAQVPLGCLSGPGSWRGPPLQLAMAPQLGGIPRAPRCVTPRLRPRSRFPRHGRGPGGGGAGVSVWLWLCRRFKTQIQLSTAHGTAQAGQ